MIEVLAPGPLTTVQDAGRHGWAHLGVPAAGPADWLGHALANRLVGNEDGAAALEFTASGPRLLCRVPVLLAVVGAVASVDGAPAGPGSVVVRAGATVAVGPCRPGVRGYVGVAGGVGVPPVLGSRSTDTLSGLGPAPLTKGAVLQVSASDGPLRVVDPGYSYAEDELRVVAGPDEDWTSSRLLYEVEWTVTPRSDRVGVRLAGPALTRTREGEAPVAGMAPGALQVPPDGQPILLLANHGPTGGYPVAGVVATADLPAASRARPGSRLRFRPVTADEARAALAERYAELAGAVRIR